MLEVSYRLSLDYPTYVILSQYYDYEHIQVVHPKTLGEYRLVEVRDEGCEVLYDQLWPARRGRPRPLSRVRHRYRAPLSMEFDFIEGRYRGTRVRTSLAPQSPQRTLIEESYFIPGLPNWRVLARLLEPLIMAKVNRIWKEDLDVGVCIDGWPGVPASARAAIQRQEAPVHPALPPPDWPSAPIPEGQGRCYQIGGRVVAVFKADGQLHGLEQRCPHTGGPLSLGRVTPDKQCVECPWHGARFKLATGEHVAGPGRAGVEVVPLGAGR